MEDTRKFSQSHKTKMLPAIMKINEIYTHVIIKNICYFQIGIGISVNTFLLLFHVFMVLQDCRAKPTELITCHLALVHIIFGLWTCLMCYRPPSSAQAQTGWLKFKHTLTNYINSNVTLFTVAYSNTSQTNPLVVSEYCSISPTTPIMRGLFFILTFSRDVFFVGLMMFSSAYMVFLLFRHHRRSLHLHRSILSIRHSPEQRATWTILALVSVFVVTYWMNLIISFCSRLLWRYDPVLLSLQKLVLNAYATVCPVIQMTFLKRIHNIVQFMDSPAL
ncbi:hypothetical protein U0070_000138 [Myodes glareolus]|uniref:Vomeronasal type-1 receptor n=1 Tax=Myodes glareolus TaxID=447135 RepID=A0AAW0H3F7_MYOGA